ncbi:MAG TPA: TraM recognition domain-containing protein [Acidimicrobiales bacterium]|nr:TraM recognition domain-containing protein [Acidimicrobiales bacterium]
MDPLDELRRETAEHGYGIRLGGGSGGRAAFVPPEHGLLVIGPPRSGKTSSLVVPNVLSACGPVIATSTKADLLRTTAHARSRVGECLLFDPGGRTPPLPGVRPVGWSPLLASHDWDGATLLAQTMVLTARPASERGEAFHWSERAQALLAPAFHAAALEEMGMSRLAAMVDRRQGTELRAVLARHDVEIPLRTLEGILETDEREQSAIWSTAASILSAYRSERAIASSTGEAVDFERLVRGGDTLYICSGSEDQRHAAPLVAGLIRDVRAAAYRAAAAGELGYACGSPPVLLVLDELANIAPLHDLPALVSEGGSQGVVTLACLQDLSQAVARWGRLGEGFLSLFNTKVVFPGVGDTRTLEAFSLLAGEHEVESVTRTDGDRLAGLAGLLGARHRQRRSVGTRKERRLPVDLIARGLPGHALCMDGARPSFVETRPWWQDRAVRAAAGEAPGHTRAAGGAVDWRGQRLGRGGVTRTGR